MLESRSLAELPDDALLRWAAGDLSGGRRAFGRRAATAVAAPDLSTRDRLAVAGPVADVAELVRAVLPVVGPTFRPIGDEALIRDVVALVPELVAGRAFGWMQTAVPTGRGDGAHWLADTGLADVRALLDTVFPHSNAHPDRPGPRRWAGIRAADGSLLTCAADAWSAPSVGYLAGVATAEPARGRGLATEVCGFVLDRLVAEHGRAALMVDIDNPAAIRLYRTLGLSWRQVAAAHVR